MSFKLKGRKEVVVEVRRYFGPRILIGVDGVLAACSAVEIIEELSGGDTLL